MRYILAYALGFLLALAMQVAIAMPNDALALVALSFGYGFDSVLRSERLRKWWNGPA
jgi:hypothetical protein